MTTRKQKPREAEEIILYGLQKPDGRLWRYCNARKPVLESSKRAAQNYAACGRKVVRVSIKVIP